MMRYVHTKIWEAKLFEALVTRCMKEKIVVACPNIKIGGMPGSSSVEHLVTLKTWMLMQEENKCNGIFQTFNMEKFFDKESLMDVMNTLHKEAKICDKDYRLELEFKVITTGLISKAEEIIQVSESPMMNR